MLSRVYHTRQGKNTPICQSLPFFLRTQRLPRNAPYNKRQNTAVIVIPCLCFLRMALTYIVPVRYCMNRGSENGAPAGGAFLVDIPEEAVAEVRGPDELRLLIFPQPLDGALKNQNAAPASPPCFRRRRRSAPLLFSSCTAHAKNPKSNDLGFLWWTVQDSNL